MTETLMKLIADSGVNLKEECVLIAFADGTVEASLEDGELSITVNMVDQMVIRENETIENLLLGDNNEEEK